MASLSVVQAGGVRPGALLIACVAEHGSAAHPYFGSDSLRGGPEAGRNLADAAHFLCALHGRQPGLIELAAGRTADAAARAWLESAAETMAAQRLFLTRLAVAAGPVPSTPGGAESETAVIGQRGALATLALSDRTGCALGAALAFAADWEPVRTLLDGAAQRFGIEIPAFGLGDSERLSDLADAAAATPPVERALLFGAQQLALQHRGLWDLLEARALARDAVAA